MKIVLHLLLFCLLTVSFSTRAQQNYIDSLIRVLGEQKVDTSKFSILSDLSDNAPDGQWQIYNNQMGELANRLMNSEDQAIQRCAKKYYGSYLNNMGFISIEAGDYATGLDYYLKSSRYYNKYGSMADRALILNNIGSVFDRMGEIDKALEYYQQSLSILEHLTDNLYMVATLNNIAVIYGKKNETQKQFEVFKQGLDFAKSKSIKNHAVCGIYRGLGDNLIGQKKFEVAEFYFKEGLALSKEIGDKSDIASHLSGLAKLRYRDGHHEEALRLATEAYKAAQKIHYLREIAESANLLSSLYEEKGDHKLALQYFKIKSQMRDSLSRVENQKSVLRFQFQSEFEKKETQAKLERDKKDAIAQAELQKQKLARNGFIGGFVIVLLFAASFFRQRNEIKKGNIALQAAKERAEQSEQFEQQFLANMSHEIRTPMNAVVGMTNLLLNSPLNQKQLFYLDGIKKSSNNLLHIINDILDISKIEAGKMELESIDFSISSVARQVIQTLRHKAEEKGLELLLLESLGDEDIVLGDPVRLNQVLINLAGNAIKFTERGSISIDIRKTESGIKFAVIDTGIGIPKDKLQRVFESFTQANASDNRKHGGTGLGLSISLQLVHLMGGQIQVESTEGFGTTFYFTLRFERGSEERLKIRLEEEEHTDGSVLDELKILIVDDNEYNRIVAKDTLEAKSKAEVMAVAGAREALDLLKKKKFDVVLMDVQMPDMNGFEATRFIREKLDAPVKDIPIVALTASVMRTEIDKCKQSGMNSYIPKPFRAHQLISGIAQVLNIRLKSRANHTTVDKGTNGASHKVTNLAYLRQFCEEDPKRIKKYVDLFIQSAPGFVQTLEGLKTGNDPLALANQIHGFKTKWIMMGMNSTKDLAQRIESACRDEQNGQIQLELVNQLISDVQAAISELMNQT